MANVGFVELRLPMMLPPSWVSLASDWVTEQPTWVLPAIPTKASKQDRSPATQGSVARDKQASSDAQGSVARGKQASSGAQGYLSLALDMVKSFWNLCSRCLSFSTYFPCTHTIFSSSPFSYRLWCSFSVVHCY